MEPQPTDRLQNSCKVWEYSHNGKSCAPSLAGADVWEFGKGRIHICRAHFWMPELSTFYEFMIQNIFDVATL